MRLVPGTVRLRVTAAAATAIVVVLAVVGAALVVNHRRALTDNLDEQLASQVDAIAAVLADGGTPDLAYAGEDDWGAQVVARDGAVLDASPWLAGQPAIGGPIASGQAFRSIGKLPGGDDEMRLLTRVVDVPGSQVIVHVAASLDDVGDSVAVLVASLLVGVPIAAAVLAVLTWFVVGRTLRPVERIRAEVAEIGGADLHRRVPVPATEDEIGRLARTMNDMLGRVESASQRQRHFVADASHELRSPLTRMRTELEVDATHPDTADPSATHRSVLDEVVGLQRLVDDLLHLARSDAGGAASRREAVDVAAIAARTVERANGREGLSVETTSSGSGEALTLGDPAELARALRNVLDNAVRHAASEVRVAVDGDHDTVSVSVEDDGPGIPLDQRERIFERFTRVDAARSTRAGGAGLGLSIARDIVERHGGTITVDSAHDGGGVRFVITLPASSHGR